MQHSDEAPCDTAPLTPGQGFKFGAEVCGIRANSAPLCGRGWDPLDFGTHGQPWKQRAAMLGDTWAQLGPL